MGAVAGTAGADEGSARGNFWPIRLGWSTPVRKYSLRVLLSACGRHRVGVATARRVQNLSRALAKGCADTVAAIGNISQDCFVTAHLAEPGQGNFPAIA